MSLGAAFAFLGRLEVGARMPLYTQDGEPTGDPQMEFTSTPATGTARGDLTPTPRRGSCTSASRATARSRSGSARS